MTNRRNFLGRERDKERGGRRGVNWQTERNCFVQSCQILKHEINIKRAAVTAEKQQQENREGEKGNKQETCAQ